MTAPTLGSHLYAFFEDYLKVQKGLRLASVQSYRDALRLFLCFVAKTCHRKLSRLSLSDLTAERVLAFLHHLETDRGNHVTTRNHRLAALHTFFEYLASRSPEVLDEAQRVACIPIKRTHPPQTHFLERDDIQSLFSRLPSKGRLALRDRTLLLFLYNTGARVQEVADLRVENLELRAPPRVHLCGKGGKWRVCPLWAETASLLARLLDERTRQVTPGSPVFVSGQDRPLTRFGIYKLVRRHAGLLCEGSKSPPPRLSPHVFRHTTAVHLLEAGVEVNVIRGWLGHVSLDTTNRYAEINVRAKEEALLACQPPTSSSEVLPRKPIWRDDETLLKWLENL
jgi:integrase/recombinase XerD